MSRWELAMEEYEGAVMGRKLKAAAIVSSIRAEIRIASNSFAKYFIFIHLS